MDRRDFLKSSGALTARLIAGQMLVTSALASKAQAQTGLPISDLVNALAADGSKVLTPSDAEFAARQIAFNKRVELIPQVRVLPTTPEGVANSILWARSNQVPFAVRSGGHSYEGFSQSNGLVIDTRLLNTLTFDASTQTLEVGAGVTLGEVYNYLAQFDAAIPAGSCPPVGVSGHTLGGGFGLIARKFGLACDNVVAMEIVDAHGKILQVNANENPDLFWALRGGGNGNFGIVTRFIFQTHTVKDVITFGMSWSLPPAEALKVFKDWQQWAPNAPDEFTSIFHVSNGFNGNVSLHCAGLTLSDAQTLQLQLHNLNAHSPAHQVSATPMSFINSVHHFGGNPADNTVFMKAKSDYLLQPMSDDGITMLMKQLIAQPPGVTALFDSYGGAISRIKNDDTAFVHRQNAKYVIQYYSEWQESTQTEAKLDHIRTIYNAMRPYVSGESYVNYCDLDLENYPHAYWSTNLPRLVQIKNQYDPQNFFRHAQSMPLSLS